ncbi:MAG: transketolase [Microgenomates group bacterium]
MYSAQELQKMANLMRSDVLRVVHRAGAGHIAGPLSSSDIFATLYFSGLVDLKKDKIVLSCGHYCPVQYSALAHAGYFPVAELSSFMQLGSRLPGHPEKNLTPGIEVSAGPLGQGVSVATGIALGLKMKYGHLSQADTPRVYCVLSDGELQEGQVWEAFNFAVRRQLDNLIFILDRNKIQIENYVSQLATYGEVVGRLESFGLHTIEINGNEISELVRAIERAKKVAGGPAMIVANTVAGKGVSFMENDPKWHDKVPNDTELEDALKELQ